MENIFFLVLVAVVGLLRFLMQVAEKKRNASAEKKSDAPATNMPPSRAPAQTEEERMRKFFEALGVPTSASPPPKVQPRQVTPRTPRGKRPILPVDPFPAPRTFLPPVVQAPPPAPPLGRVEPTDIPPPVLQRAGPRQPAASIPKAERTTARFEVADPADRTVFGDLSDPAPATTRDVVPASQQLVSRLRTPEGLRDAVVLREIFGPPRSMQPLAHTLIS